MAIDYLSALGVGSGINTQEVVTALVEAERAPKQSAIDRNISRSEAKISGYGAMKSSLAGLKDAFDLLRKADDLNALTISASGTVGFDATVSASADVGSFELQVTALADNDGWGSGNFTTTDQSLNTGSDITLTVTTGSGTSQIVVTQPTPEAVVEAINSSGLDLSAKILNVGGANPYRITVYGETGSDAAFTLSSDSLDLDFSDQLSVAQDAQIEVDGISVTRSTNSFDDVITGVSITAFALMDDAQITTVSQDKTILRSRLVSLVEVYNAVDTNLRNLYLPTDAPEGTTGSLTGDSLARSVVSKVRALVTEESSSAATDVGYLTDLGISIDRYGKLSLDESTLDTVLADDFDQVITMLTNDLNGVSRNDASIGLAGDAFDTLDDLLGSSGDIERSIDVAESQVTEYQEALEKLDERMEKIRARYMSQFSAMQSIVDRMNSTRDYLKQQFDALNNNKD
jgi:flagellar hook-associated protein 2